MALNGLTGSTGLNFNSVNSTIYDSIRSQEGNLQTTLANMRTNADGSISPGDMLKMQQQLQQWTMLIEMQSTMTKQIADSLKGVIQKAS